MKFTHFLLALLLVACTTALHFQRLPTPNNGSVPATPSYPNYPNPQYPNPNPVKPPPYNPNQYNPNQPQPQPQPIPSNQQLTYNPYTKSYPGPRVPEKRVSMYGVVFTYRGPFTYVCKNSDGVTDYRYDTCYNEEGCARMVSEYFKNCVSKKLQKYDA